VGVISSLVQVCWQAFPSCSSSQLREPDSVFPGRTRGRCGNSAATVRGCDPDAPLFNINGIEQAMGVLLSLPLAGGLTTIGSSCLAGLAFCCTSTAGSFRCPSLHTNKAQYNNTPNSVDVLQIMQLQLLYCNSCRLCRTLFVIVSRNCLILIVVSSSFLSSTPL